MQYFTNLKTKLNINLFTGIKSKVNYINKKHNNGLFRPLQETTTS